MRSSLLAAVGAPNRR